MTRLLFTITLLSFYTVILNAQTTHQAAKVSNLNTDYNRNALTVLVRQNTSTYFTDLKNASDKIAIPGKFDNNLIDTRIIPGKKTDEALQKSLINNKIPNEILAKWFDRDDNTGQFDMSIIHERGLYNATDDEVRKAAGSKIGISNLKDAGETLINGSYILVLDFYNIESYKEKYDKQDARARKKAEKDGTDFNPVKRRKNGWTGSVSGFLYKLNFNDSVLNVFYNDLWIYDSDDATTRTQKMQQFKSNDFPVEFITKVNANADGSQYNPGEILASAQQLNRNELFQKMINTGLEDCLFDLEREVSDFKVKTPLYDVKPLKAKVGKKEGLKTENRYFVYEFEQNRAGETIAKRKGVVRAKKVIDNKIVATGSSADFSTFYQVAGRKLLPGMTMEQNNDFGIGISGGFIVSGTMGGGYVKAEVNVGALAGNAVDVGLNQVKIIGTAALDLGTYSMSLFELSEENYDMTFTRFQLGLAKSYYFARNFSFTPYAAYAMETASNSDMFDEIYENDRLLEFEEPEGQSLGSDFLSVGAYLTVNVTYWMQLMGGVNLYAPIGTVYDSERKELTLTESGATFKYNDVFDDRKGASFDLGIRIEF